MFRTVLTLALIATPIYADDLTEKDFRRASMSLLENPTGPDAEDMAKAVIVFTAQTEKAMVVIDEEETKWAGTDEKFKPILMAAYAAGNVQAQLNSGVMRNDRYSGVMNLFGTYRKIQEKDKTFKVEAVEALLKLHKDDKLTAHLAELEKKNPTTDRGAPKKDN